MPTEQCNFRCSYCYETFTKPVMTQAIIDNLKGYLVRNIKKYNSFCLEWFGGKPLCATKEVMDISKYCLKLAQKAGIPFISTITTNGYLLNPELIQDLIKMHIIG